MLGKALSNLLYLRFGVNILRMGSIVKGITIFYWFSQLLYETSNCEEFKRSMQRGFGQSKYEVGVRYFNPCQVTLLGGTGWLVKNCLSWHMQSLVLGQSKVLAWPRDTKQIYGNPFLVKIFCPLLPHKRLDNHTKNTFMEEKPFMASIVAHFRGCYPNSDSIHFSLISNCDKTIQFVDMNVIMSICNSIVKATGPHQ